MAHKTAISPPNGSFMTLGTPIRIRVARRDDAHMAGAVGRVAGPEQDHADFPGYRFLPVQLVGWPAGVLVAVPVGDLEPLR